jgi:alpha-1,6-mannosyltransferase
MRGARRDLPWAWVGLGLAGSLLLTAAASKLLDGRPIHWFFTVHPPGGHRFSQIVFWAGVLALCAAWLGIGRRLSRSPGLGVGPLLAIGALWSVPLWLGPAVFSHDMYSYLAQGTLLHHGVDPYQHAPAALAGLHQTRLLGTVSPFWQHTTAPYGPTFIALASLIAGLTGSHLVVGVLLIRALELAGLALLAVFVPRLARATGADPARATWLAVISPLVLLELVGAGHNDALMAGLLVAGVTLAVQRRPLMAIAICALAATIKLPAAAAIVLIAVCWARAEPRRVASVLAQSAAVVVGVLLAAGLISGVGLHWISGGLLSTPGKVHLAITPATALGYSVASALHSLGVGAGAHALESAFGAVALLLTAALGVALCLRVRYERLALYLGVLLVASVVGGPATWPWYLTWGVALLAATPVAQRSRVIPAVLVASVLVVRPDGIVALPIGGSPYVLAVYVLAVLAALLVLRPRLRPRRRRRSVAAVA